MAGVAEAGLDDAGREAPMHAAPASGAPNGVAPEGVARVRAATLSAAALATLLAAFWVREPRVSYLVGALVATVAAAALAWRDRRARAWMLAFSAAAVAFATPALWTQRSISLIEDHWAEMRATRVGDAEAAYARAVVDAATELAAVARNALDVRDSSDRSFGALARSLPAGRGERGVVVLHGGRPVTWAGVLRVPLDSMTAPVGTAATTFYVVLYASASRGDARAVATELLQAQPPASALARSMDRVLASRTDGWRADFAVPRPGLDSSWHAVRLGGRPVVAMQAQAPGRQVYRARVGESGRTQAVPGLALMVLVTVAAAWYGARRSPRAALARRLVVLLLPLATIQIVPLSGLSNTSRLFDPSVFYAPHGGRFTASLGALGITGGVLLLALLAVLRSGRLLLSRRWSALLVLAITAVAPFVFRDLARGITPPSLGATVNLWIAWQVALFLPAAALLIAGATAGRLVLGRGRGVPPLVAPILAAVAAALGPVVWGTPGGWPRWYTLLWVVAVGALAFTRRTRVIIVTASAVAGLGATTLVWGAVARKRVTLAVEDVRGLTQIAPYVEGLLERLARDLADAPPTTQAELLRRFAASPLSYVEPPVLLASWVLGAHGDSVAASVATDAVSVDSAAVRHLVANVRETGEAAITTLPGTPGVTEVLAVPHGTTRVTTVAVFSPTRLLPASPLAPLLGLRAPSAGEPPYTLTTLERVPRDAPNEPPAAPTWTREGSEIHGDWVVASAAGRSRAHIEVELRPFDVLAQRGALLVLLDLAVVGLLWTVPAAADGTVRQRLRAWRGGWGRSYRSRLTVALFGFFVVPAAAFAVWSYRELQSSDVQGRSLLVRETLRAAATEVPNVESTDLAGLSDRLGTPLLVYDGGVLRRASDRALLDVAPVGLLLPRDEAIHVAFGDEVQSSRAVRVGRVETLLGYRAVVGADAQRLVVAAPARTDDPALEQRRRDLGFLVLLVAAGGALAALWLSGLAARELARPVGALRAAALAIAGGEREPTLGAEPPTEFRPVFNAFRRMASDLNESRSALEAAQRRTAAVLRNVASGVLAVRHDGTITIANPRAEQLLGTTLPAGAPIASLCPAPLVERITAFLATPSGASDEEFDLELHDRQLRARLTRLDATRAVATRTGATRGGDDGAAVLTVDDLTELARAQRVLAWGEMARQVAHEIKNPLTPIRLGMQHLRRAYHDRRGNFDEILERNVVRVLAEIDRLDEIARTFSRYGTAPDQRPPGRPTDVAAVARDTVALERIGEGAVEWEIDGADAPVIAVARDDELREVLLNLLENARHAHARHVRVSIADDERAVTLRVADDGEGIPDELQSRVFEPHFSTRTSGSGLGLAISRRIIDGWGGSITLRSRRGVGTTIVITLRPASLDDPVVA